MLGFGLDPYGTSLYGGVYLDVNTNLIDNSFVRVGQKTEEEACIESIAQRLISRIHKVWRIAARTPGSVTNAFIMAQATQLCQFLSDFKLALLELNIMTASGYWLDKWGQYFRVSRAPNETDVGYRFRILAVLKSPKCTKRAILDRVTPFLLEEPQEIEYMYDGIPFSLLPGDDIVSMERKRARMELVIKTAEPSDRVFYVDYSFINREIFEPDLEACETYIFDNSIISQFIGGFALVKNIVKKTKMAGIRVFYRTGNTYIR